VGVGGSTMYCRVGIRWSPAQMSKVDPERPEYHMVVLAVMRGVVPLHFEGSKVTKSCGFGWGLGLTAVTASIAWHAHVIYQTHFRTQCVPFLRTLCLRRMPELGGNQCFRLGFRAHSCCNPYICEICKGNTGVCPLQDARMLRQQRWCGGLVCCQHRQPDQQPAAECSLSKRSAGAATG
jgi:hypothetical protein